MFTTLKAGSNRLPRECAAAAAVLLLCVVACGSVAAQEIAAPLNTAPLRVVHEPGAEVDQSAFRTAAIATIAGNVFDTVTTVTGMNSGHMRETNPVLGQHVGTVVLFKSLLVVPVVLAEKHLVDTGHPNIARFLGYAVGGFSTTLGIHNLRAAH